MLLRFTAYLLLFFIPLISQAQSFGTVYGSVIDSSGKAIPGILVAIAEDGKYSDISGSRGNFSLKVPAEKDYTLYISSEFYSANTIPIRLKAEQVLQLEVKLTEKNHELLAVVVTAVKEGVRGQSSTTYLKPISTSVSVSGNLEDILKYSGLGVASMGGESSSAYSVRGGNFDENLVYVNDFEILRPFLVRSAQQEGLSFSNPDLTDHLIFSSGGFQPKYGDKLSSVLDVTYKRPEKNAGSITASMLGAQAHLELASKDSSFSVIGGVRYKNSQYVLNALQTDGEYSPSFLDGQLFSSWKFHKKWEMGIMGNYSRNRYYFKPVNRETDFGLVSYTLRLQVYFDGAERDHYETYMGGLSFKQKPNDRTVLKYLSSIYQSSETENFDIIGEYFLGEVETDISKENFDQIKFGLGSGAYHNWAKNHLMATVWQTEHKGEWLSEKKNHLLQWGLSYRHEWIDDRISEWNAIDSAFYTLPYSDAGLPLKDVLKSKTSISSNRYQGYFQDTWKSGARTLFNLTYGFRLHYWDLNKEWLLSPRVQAAVIPVNWKDKNQDVVFTFAAGMYQQAPFYREMRALDGSINTNLKAQKSAHFVSGVDYNFKAWDRPFKFVTEAYFKYMWDLVPYELDNVMLRYYGRNEAVGYATGIDFRLNGELVKGDESYLSLSIMNIREDLLNDSYTQFLDDTGGIVYLGYGRDEEITDTTTIYPGFIAKPTDQRVNFAMFFQDHIPKHPGLRVHLNLVFGSGFPFGPPGGQRYQQTGRITPYRRVDIGFSAMLFDRARYIEKNQTEPPKKSVYKVFNSLWISAEVWNIFGINNTVSYLWIKDNYNRQFAVPNYLSARRFNIKLMLKF